MAAKKVQKTAKLAIILLLGMIFSLLRLCFSSKRVVFSAETVDDGTYSVPVDLSDLSMGKDNFTKTATVEKQGENYYFTFGFSSSIGYVNLSVEGEKNKEVGKTTEQKGGWIYHTYTLSETSLTGKFNITAYINAMKRETDFSISLQWNSKSKTSEDVRDIGERPAQFVPTITTKAAAEYSLKVGTVFPIPEAAATLGDENCEISTFVTHNGEEVIIDNGKFSLESVGTYILTYKATSDMYKTSLGNDTFTEYVVKVESATGENETAKFEDINGVLPENTGVLAGKLDETSSDYQTAAAAMKDIADNFEVFSVELVDENGEKVMPKGKIKWYFKANDYFDRTKVAVYYMDENGKISELSAKGYGRYITAETEKTGTFIVCVPGVEFVMPMWGYAVIVCVGGAIVIAAAITIPVVIVKKRKKKGKSA